MSVQPELTRPARSDSPILPAPRIAMRATASDSTEPPAARPWVVAERARRRAEVARGQLLQLARADVVEPRLQPHRLRVQRLLEQRARVARVAERLAAALPAEDPADRGRRVVV